MKTVLLTKLFLGSTFILSGFLFIASAVANPSQTTKYRCIYRNGTPTTVADTDRGQIELIVWKSHYFGPKYPPDVRCREVTARFQRHSDANNMKYISTGVMNRYNVICVSTKSGNCKPNSLLITLPHKDNPQKVLRDLFNLEQPITRPGRDRPITVIIDMKYLLENRDPIANIPEEPTEGNNIVIENPL